ncbi:hypothetical protein PVAG01_09311 [Phlyctema vagabunda]|uniref:WIBG Mago-binding domain-containing protein n=1 Tax=Phlyctema vagabunda TaxID=108571 RepID=A0ABR4P6Z7_9HELO
MPSVPTESTTTASGAIISPKSGNRHIPASLRPDGSKRKEIKIRPGYKPPEDVEVYRNRAASAWKSRGTGGVPGAESLKSEPAAEGGAANDKNKKRRDARKKAAEGKKDEENGPTDALDTSASQEKGGATATEDVVDPEVEREKKARNLKKKLKQAKELKEKKEGGAALLPEQFAKVIKMNELIRELDALGFDAEGEPKAKGDEVEQNTSGSN